MPGIMSIKVNGNKAMFGVEGFRYVSLWSQAETWGVNGGLNPPPGLREDVLIPAGKRVVMDVLNLEIGVLTIEGTFIIDLPTAAMNLTANTIVVNKGMFIVGSTDVTTTPLAFPITILLTGTKIEGKTTKAIVCNSCGLYLHGNPRPSRWVQSTSADPTADTIAVPQTIDWAANEEILLGPNLHNYESFEVKQISSVGAPAAGLKDVTVQGNFAAPRVVTTGTANIPYQHGTEVALTSRFVSIIGTADATNPGFGPRIIINGPIAESNNRVIIKDVSMDRCGQAMNAEGCCIHFNNNGDLSGSVVEGVVASNTNHRMMTIVSGSHLVVNNNVGFNIAGHGIALGTGSEMFNTITNNLIVRTKSNPEIGGSDMMPAGIFVTNPQNTIEANVVAGSDAYGIAYFLAPSTTFDKTTCPEGIPLLSSKDNIVHSNKMAGLMIMNYAPRRNPCAPARNNSLPNPWSTNQPVQAEFINYAVYANPVGVSAQNIGQLKFTDFSFGDNNRTSLWLDKAGLSPSPVLVSGGKFIVKTLQNDAGIRHQLFKPPTDNGLVFDSCKHANFAALREWLDLSDVYKPVIFKTAFTYDPPGSAVAGQEYTLKWDMAKSNIVYDETGIVVNQLDAGSRTSGVLLPRLAHLEASTVCPFYSAGTALGWD